MPFLEMLASSDRIVQLLSPLSFFISHFQFTISPVLTINGHGSYYCLRVIRILGPSLSHKVITAGGNLDF